MGQWGNGRLWTHALPRPWWFCSPGRFPSPTWSLPSSAWRLPPSNWILPYSTWSSPTTAWRLSSSSWSLPSWTWRLSFTAWKLSATKWWLSSCTRWPSTSASRLPFPARGRGLSSPTWSLSSNGPTAGRLSSTVRRNGGHDGQWNGWYDGREEGQESRKESKEGCKVWSTSGCPGSWRLYGFQEFQGREIGFQLQLQFI